MRARDPDRPRLAADSWPVPPTPVPDRKRRWRGALPRVRSAGDVTVLVISEDVRGAPDAMARVGIDQFHAMKVDRTFSVGFAETVRALGADTIAYPEGCAEEILSRVVQGLGVRPPEPLARYMRGEEWDAGPDP